MADVRLVRTEDCIEFRLLNIQFQMHKWNCEGRDAVQNTRKVLGHSAAGEREAAGNKTAQEGQSFFIVLFYSLPLAPASGSCLWC